jgi:DNA-binding NarL/FixJ family response regulator
MRMTILEAIKTSASVIETKDDLSEAIRVLIMAVAESERAPDPVKAEPVEEPKKEAPKKPGPKPGTKPKGQKKIDDGKIRVLREGGWSITAIADEMKLSAPTVKAHLQKMGVK